MCAIFNRAALALQNFIFAFHLLELVSYCLSIHNDVHVND